MKDTLRYATISPDTLLTDLTFWKSQRLFLSIVLFAIVVIFVLLSWTYPERTNWTSYLSFPIHLLIVWGIYVAAVAMSKTQIEHSIADYVENKAANELRKIKSGEKERIDLSRIEHEFLPHNPSKGISMIRLFQHILKEAKDRKFESSVLVMQPYREESMGNLFRLQTIQKSALHLGILGTFIGLIKALKELTVGPEGILNIENFNSLFGSLHIAFGTSVAGLEVAICLGALATLVHRKQEAYFQSMEEATVTLVSLARNSINKDELFNELGQIRHSIDQLTDRVYEQSQEVVTQTSEIQGGIKKLSETKAKFDEFLANIKTQQNQAIEEMKEVYKFFSPEKISEHLKNSLDKATEYISSTISDKMSQELGALKNINSLLINLNSALEKARLQFADQEKFLQEQNAELIQTRSNFNDSLKSIAETNTKIVEEVDHWMRDLSTQLEKNSAETGKNITRELKSELTSISKNFGILNTELKKFNKSVSRIAAGKNVFDELSERQDGAFLWFKRLFQKNVITTEERSKP